MTPTATSLVQQMLSTLRANGRGALDHSALLTVVEELAAREPTLAGNLHRGAAAPRTPRWADWHKPQTAKG